MEETKTNENEQKVEEANKRMETTGTEASPNVRISAIDKANIAAERLEKANKEKERLLAIEEKLLVERKLSGSTDAGQPTIKPAEKTAKEYANEVMTGKIKAN